MVMYTRICLCIETDPQLLVNIFYSPPPRNTELHPSLNIGEKFEVNGENDKTG